jgi:glutamate racemase
MKISQDSPIGIFDSGLGGLTVLKEIQELLPNENIIYLGDTARVPYGIRTPETIIKYSLSNTNFLIRHDIKLLVVACNTSSATSIESIRKNFDVPIIGVIEPGAMMAVSVTVNGHIGVIGTAATINSSAYSKAIKAFDSSYQVAFNRITTLASSSTPQRTEQYASVVSSLPPCSTSERNLVSIKVTEIACPLFVPLIEEGWLNDSITEAIALRYLKDLPQEIDTLVLGCTHYPLIKGVIGSVMGKDVRLVDSAFSTAIQVKQMLLEMNLLSNSKKEGAYKFYVTDGMERFKDIGRKFLLRELDDIEVIDLLCYEVAGLPPQIAGIPPQEGD